MFGDTANIFQKNLNFFEKSVREAEKSERRGLVQMPVKATSLKAYERIGEPSALSSSRKPRGLTPAITALKQVPVAVSRKGCGCPSRRHSVSRKAV